MSRFFRGARNPVALAFGPAVAAQYGADVDAGEVDDPTVIAAAWNSGTAYYPGMQVTSGGNYYYCLVSCRSVATSDITYWKQITNIYYFTSAGDDATGIGSPNASTAKAAPFKTITKAADFMCNNGTPDIVDAPRGSLFLFNRGETFQGSIFARGNDGTSHEEYIVGAYGTGVRPVFKYLNTSPSGYIASVISAGSGGAGTNTESGFIVRNIVADGQKYVTYSLTQSVGATFAANDVISKQSDGTKQGTIKEYRNGGVEGLFITVLHDTVTDFFSTNDIFQTSGGAKVGTATARNSVGGLGSTRPGFTVYNCEVRNCTSNGIGTGYQSIIGRGDNVVVYNSVIHDCCLAETSGAGCDLTWGANIKFLHNTTYDNGCGSGVRSHNCYFDDFTSSEFAYNWSYMTSGTKGNHAFVIHGVCADVDIHHNLMDGCQNGLGVNGGYLWSAAESFTRINVYGNTIRNMGVYAGAGLAMDLASLVDCKIYNNLCHTNLYPVNIVDRNGSSGAFTPASTSNLQIYYNTFINAAASAVPTVKVAGALVTNVQLKDNIIVSKNAGQQCFQRLSTAPAGEVHLAYNLFYDAGTSNVIDWGGVIYTVAGFAAATSEGANSVQAAPSFMNEGAGDYSLTSSPAFHTGTPVSGITTDFAGAARSGSTPSMGAYEGTS